MANVAHSTLTGSELHEPKGVENANLGEVYVADGAGSGNWQSVGTSSFTGMIADFAAPVAPVGWLECDGSTISTSTYSGLFAVMSMTVTGTRSNGSPVITSIASTSDMRVGYYVFGTGISSGTTIVSINSASQITLSNNASSSGTATFFVCPWLMNTGTVQLPNLTGSGLYRRSRQTGITKVGDAQTSQNLSHSHVVNINSGGESNGHVHTFSGTTSGQSVGHTHNYQHLVGDASGQIQSGGGVYAGTTGNFTSGGNNSDHTHSYSGTTSDRNVAHFHNVSGNTNADGAGEARPATMVFLTCVKT